MVRPFGSGPGTQYGAPRFHRALRLGIETARHSGTQQPGQVEVLSARQAYLSAGRFEPARMLDSLAGYIDKATSDGYRGLRLVGDMAWVLAEPAVFDELVGYEPMIDQLLTDGKALGICLHPQRDLPHDVLRQVSCGHPVTTKGERTADWVPLLFRPLGLSTSSGKRAPHRVDHH